MTPGSPPPAPDGGGTPGSERWQQRLAVARGRLFAAFFFVVFVFLLYQFYLVLTPFLAPIVWAAILALLFYPLFERLRRALHHNATAAALALTALVTLAIVVPTVSLSSVLTRQSLGLYQQVTDLVASGRLKQALDSARGSAPGRLLDRLGRLGLEIDYGTVLQRTADTVSTQVTAVARNVATFVFDFVIMLFTLFFFFRDGERMVRGLRELIPMDPEHKDAIFARLYETLAAVMRGMLASAVAQGVLSWIGLAVLGLPYAAFLGVAAGVASLIPIVGAAGVWVPCVIYLGATGALVRAAVLLAYGTLVISMVDNVLRPLIIGERTSIPTLFLFFAILGGVQAYGLAGLFLGPVLVAIVVAFAKIYQEQYATPETPRPV